MKLDKKDYLKRNDVPGNGKFRIVGQYVPKLGIYCKETFVYSLIWSTSGKTIYTGSWNSCLMNMEDIIHRYKTTNGKPYPWQFIGPVTYYNAMDQYLARQKEQITAEYKK